MKIRVAGSQSLVSTFDASQYLNFHALVMSNKNLIDMA